MKQVSISEFKKLKAEEIKAALPCEIVSDGEVIAEVKKPYVKPPNPLSLHG